MCDKKYLEGTKIEDLTGMKFGKLTVVDFDFDRYNKDKIRKNDGKIKKSRWYWMCKCECGRISSIQGDHLKSGNSSNCGMCYTFEDWCLDNNHQDWLELWDYELNNCKPSDIGFGVSKGKYWFKCPRGIHESELWSINHLTSREKDRPIHTILSCRKCNSFGQYLLDAYGNLNMWSDKNTVDPFEVTKMSGKKYYLICPICGEIKYINIDNFVNRGIACRRCSDGFSIPAKTLKVVLNQLGIEHKMEVTKLDFNWIGSYRYDFYIPSLNLIVETHGIQHYKESNRGRSLKEEQDNDKLKKELALQIGFNYCVIDCRYSELDWLKDNIIKAFGEYVDLSSIDWIKAYKYTQSSLVKEVCDYWENRMDNETAVSLAEAFGVDRGTITKYLKIGTDIGWCTYDAKEEMRKNNSINGKKSGRLVEIFKYKNSIGIFESTAELERKSEELFGVKLLQGKISAVCNGKRNHHKGFTFRYIEDVDNTYNDIVI